ncbi:MAG: RNA methyltransferase [Caldimicrobium thiodismutans]|uniref:tRNA (cytidine/uridine-2'-O-)-methyltransferase TrmJ n=1 Tax=Caldimicrobium thiodismutans TaxID=1653476 RepID=A0A2N7PLF3_9BACT|nr:MAG: RNA methyltransferase [Caldimicrobium thiodismutans]
MQVRPVAKPIKANLSNLAVVLVNPLYPENIGSVARACANFGIEELILVKPEDLTRLPMEAMATKAGLPILEKMKIYETLPEAIENFNLVIGTTARLGKRRLVHYTPKEIAKEICDLSINNRIAILFGNERLGLSNEDLFYCDKVITIPTTEKASLNVSQAVVIILYEIFQEASSGPNLKKPELATQKEINTMFKLIEATLRAIDYIPHQNPILWLTNIRRFLTSRELTSREVKIIMGFCRQFLWALGKSPKLSFEEEKEPQSDKSEETYQKDKAP